MQYLKWLVLIYVVSALCNAEQLSGEFANTLKLLSEQVKALLDRRQEDYNALEESLKQSMEKNTEFTILRNEVKQLRKEVTILRGGSGNEAKNERLRVKWLGSAVTELKSELAEVLRTQNASEELAQRARMESELALLRGDVAQVGRGIRDLGGRLTRIEAILGTIRVDITAVKERAGQLTRSCADVTSQLSAVQIEMKSLKGDSMIEHNNHQLVKNEIRFLNDNDDEEKLIIRNKRTKVTRHNLSRSYSTRCINERLLSLERKISVIARKRGMIEHRVIYETNPDFITNEILENLKDELSERLQNISNQVNAAEKQFDDLAITTFQSIGELATKVTISQSEMKRESARLDINAARKNAELSLTREELSNLRRTVQALSVSASKLQEKSDIQQDIITKLDKQLKDLINIDINRSLDKAINITYELEHVEDQYRLIVDALPGNCDARDGLTLLGAGQGTPLLVSCHGGWIIVAQRVNGIVDFDRTWSEYASGFGSPLNEFWVGNEALHRLTRDNCTRLRIDLTDIYGTKWRAEYDYFNVQSEDTGYRLHVGGYSGNATDAFSYQNGMAFSAKDRDMDISTADCAANYHGGWWFSHCQHANLNARYSLGLTWYQSNNNEWMAVGASTMSIQRKENCLRS
ncbi:hypothetical protein PV327_002965 [Microctonus hyperodae]|uniref:Fibrinogen C-terminal domain-containing protein n=1 Tax=Microctonus hyperodae TaxID=165561 RepID=A0AA39G311_MICHY|nr:hypothetical protein PV327_002965 [Microctonus hyperodae]